MVIVAVMVVVVVLLLLLLVACVRAFVRLCVRVCVCVYECVCVCAYMCVRVSVLLRALLIGSYRKQRKPKDIRKHISPATAQTYIAAQYVRMRTHIHIPADAHCSRWVTDFFCPLNIEQWAKKVVTHFCIF